MRRSVKGAPDEIEITPEMIEAGALELVSLGDYETPHYWAARIIRAALGAAGFSVMASEE